MKSIKKILYLLFLITTVIACDLEKITSLQDEFKIIVNPDAVFNKKEIEVVNATNENRALPKDLAITIFGENASNIYTSDGNKTLTFDKAKIVIGLTKNVSVSTENPIRLTAKFSAEGYISKTIDLIFDGTPVETIIIPLLEKENLPDSVTHDEKTEAVTEGTTAAEVNTEKVTIPVHTKIKDKNENTVNGELKITVESYDLKTDSNLSTVDLIPIARTKNGNIIEITSYDLE